MHCATFLLRFIQIVQTRIISSLRDQDSQESTSQADEGSVRQRAPVHEIVLAGRPPWALEMRAFAAAEPESLLRIVTGAILGCGGWVLSRGANDAGEISLLFEFERSKCVEMYSALVGAGIELSPSGHRRLTELCRCTRLHSAECGQELASVELEIQTISAEGIEGLARSPRA